MKDNKQRLFEVIGKLDSSFKSNIQEIFEPDYSNGEYFEDKLEEIIQQMIQSDYGYEDIQSLVEKILQRQP